MTPLQSDVANDLGSSSLAYGAAELRSTQTGAVLARITPPKPYASFTGVTCAADDRTFVLAAQGPQPSVVPPFPSQRFFLLRIDPAARAGARMTLTALPARYVPGGHGIHARKLGEYEQILYTSGDGRVLVLTYQRPGAKAAIVHDGRPTPIPWSPYIGVAAW